MSITMTKAELNKVLVGERKKSRIRQRQSAFMRRSLSIYNGQKARLADLREQARQGVWAILDTMPAALPYTLDELRQAMQKALAAGVCCYCGAKLTVKKITPDHKESLASGGSWNLENIGFCDQSCNWQKGKMTEKEFRRLIRFCSKYLSSDSAADLKKRLSIGGVDLLENLDKHGRGGAGRVR